MTPVESAGCRDQEAAAYISKYIVSRLLRNSDGCSPAETNLLCKKSDSSSVCIYIYTGDDSSVQRGVLQPRERELITRQSIRRRFAQYIRYIYTAAEAKAGSRTIMPSICRGRTRACCLPCVPRKRSPPPLLSRASCPHTRTMPGL